MLFDMHVHSAEGSPCSKISAKELVRVYKEIGYDGFVLTDHMIEWYRVNCHKLEYADYCKNNYEAYLKAKEEGDKIGFTVLYGVELRINDSLYNDYLIYGADLDYLHGNPDIFSWTIDKLSAECKKNGFLMYQAHPFRNCASVTPQDFLFGVEVFNGAHADDFRNTMADVWADHYKLHKIAGSDCHSKEGAGKAGVDFFSKISDISDLMDALKNNEYYLYKRHN